MESNGEYGYRKSTSGGALAGSPQLSDVAQQQRCSIETTERFTDVTSAIHSTDLKSMYCKKKNFQSQAWLVQSRLSMASRKLIFDHLYNQA